VLDAASSGFDIGFEGQNNATLLFVALRSNEVRAFQCLLDAGANPTQMTDGIPLLSRAVLLEDLRFARSLIEYGADPNTVSETTGRRPIHSATLGGIQQIQVLLDAGADLNASTEIHKATAVMDAAALGRFEMVEFLLDEGASVCQRDFRDRTLLDYLRDSTSLESRELRAELIGRVQERLAEC
jgi:ankyrin repeat protein